jgi:hypothetical protein
MTDTSNPSDAEACARAIAERFGESKPRALAQLLDLAKVFGASWMFQVAERAEQEMAAAGPLTLRLRGKPRTRGGVFFVVAKKATFEALERRTVSRKTASRLFGTPPKELREKLKAARMAESSASPDHPS